MAETRSLSAAVAALAQPDKRLLKALFAGALAALGLGLAMGLYTALARAGLFAPDPPAGYRAMTLHGVTVFFYWLTFAQLGILLAIAAAESGGALAGRRLAWAGTAFLIVGFAASLIGTLWGPPLLYDGSPELIGDERRLALAFHGGYLALALGLALVALAAILTLFQAKRDGQAEWSSLGFGAVAWAGLLVVSAVALANAFLPPVRWVLGLGAFPADHATLWHVLFHNMHYLPLMAMVLVWYALMPELAGTGSILGARFSKIVFALYLLFVPPTSLYHMFLEPGLKPIILVLGSMLSLFISVPTVAAFLVIVVSIEAQARAEGAQGPLGWLKRFDWRDPAMRAIGWSVINLALGGTFAFVLIQEKLAGLLSDTFFVPGYFHFLTVGAVSLSLLAALMRLVPALCGRALPAIGLLRHLPLFITFGLLLFGGAGIAAGLAGMPRRVLSAAYDGLAPAGWNGLSVWIGVGAVPMALGLAAYVVALALPLLGLVKTGVAAIPKAAPPADPRPAIGRPAWSGPAAVALLVLAMYGATWFAFALLRALPAVASAGGGH
jgi:cytochrome c oxidase subunit 1